MKKRKAKNYVLVTLKKCLCLSLRFAERTCRSWFIGFEGNPMYKQVDRRKRNADVVLCRMNSTGHQVENVSFKHLKWMFSYARWVPIMKTLCIFYRLNEQHVLFASYLCCLVRCCVDSVWWNALFYYPPDCLQINSNVIFF